MRRYAGLMLFGIGLVAASKAHGFWENLLASFVMAFGAILLSDLFIADGKK